MNNTNLLLALICGYTFTRHGWYHGDNEEHAVKVWDDQDYDYFRRFSESLTSVMALTHKLEKEHGFLIEFYRDERGYTVDRIIKKEEILEVDISGKNLALVLSTALLKVLVTEDILAKAKNVEENYPHHYLSIVNEEK